MNVRVKWLMLVLLPLATSSVLAEGDFIQGAKVWAEVCGGCHTFRSQTDFNDNQWVTTMSHMRVRAGLTGQEMRDVVAFLQTANGPAAKATIPDAKATPPKENATPPKENATTPTGNAILNLTGYGGVDYTQTDDRDGEFFALIAPILHLQYGDKWFFDAEVELSLSQDGETDAMLEYATANYFLNDYMTIVGGQFLSPIGTFKQNLHPTWINRLPTMPIGFGHAGAAPTSDFGLQLRGALPLGEVRSSYALYVTTGPELISEYEDEEFKLESIVAEATTEDVDKPVFGGRYTIRPFRSLEFGFSYASGVATVTGVEGWSGEVHDEEDEGDHGDELVDDHGDEPVDDHGDEEEEGGHHGGASNATPIFGESARSYRVAGADISWTWDSLNLRGEYVVSTVGATDHGVTASDGREWTAWYGQATWNIPKTRFQAVTRYAEFDLKSRWTYGLNYLLSDKMLVKAAYESDPDDNQVLVQLAFGF